MKELLRWRYLPMHSIALGFWAIVYLSGCGVGGGTGIPNSHIEDERTIQTSYFSNILIVCDSQTGNLVYETSSGGLFVVKDGCSK